ncbi:class I SAM-dependent methyltransferase [Kosakonia sp. SOY2]|uniref:class I SAM-dependent methyltransferase n=1 Tax=Kosakonia sp. SOY2 TaxID=3014557 RepID=UPI0022AC7A93|nr:class I SAM-dependent methyltransferase [Kosakonia sp. SOY2]MCZ3384939.1 class I SAM-dependent methyltransferase [Kosakonia sp. SOY2]
MATIDSQAHHAGFREHYADNARPVWDIGHPQKPFIERASDIRGPILDIGCGTGTLAVYFAGRGEQVTGIDFVAEAVERAVAKTKAAGLNIDFMVQDFFTLGCWDRKFQTITDSGLFHIFSGDEVRKVAYLEIVSQLLNDDGRLYVLACKKEPGIDGGVNADEIFDTFRERFIVESLHEFEAETVIDAAENAPGRQWLSYFAVIKKRER